MKENLKNLREKEIEKLKDEGWVGFTTNYRDAISTSKFVNFYKLDGKICMVKIIQTRP